MRYLASEGGKRNSFREIAQSNAFLAPRPSSDALTAMRASEWRAFEKNTLRGFFKLHLRLLSGEIIVLVDCTLHRHPNGSEWVGLPGKPQIDAEGCHRRDAAGKALYTPVVEIPDRNARDRFQAAALAAVHAFLAKGP